jgi:hypothetical protein
MWRYLAGGGALLSVAAAGFFFIGGDARPVSVLPAQPQQAAATADVPIGASEVPEASPVTREQKRFNRYDKDRDNSITREEYLAARRKAFAKLDRNGDGRLDFDEWAVKATTKFAAADADKSGTMNPAEFATTAVKRKTPSRAKCPPQAAIAADDG